MELAWFWRGSKNFSEETTKTERGNSLNSKLSGETEFLGGSSFNLGGAMFQQGLYWGVCNVLKTIIFNTSWARSFKYDKNLPHLAKTDAKTFGEDQTPIHYAAKNDAVNSLKVLVKLGSNLNCRDFKKRTPLQLAAELGKSVNGKSQKNSHFIKFIAPIVLALSEWIKFYLIAKIAGWPK